MLYHQSLKKIRKDKKITSIELAKYLNKTRETVSAWERGIYQPGDADIRIMAQLLNVSVGDISDLQEIKVKNNNTDKRDVVDLDIDGIEPETAEKLKILNETCLELRATVTRLRSNLFKYDALLQNLPFVIYVKDKRLKYTYANERFLNLIEQSYSKNSISGASSFDIFGMKEYSQILELEQKVIKTKQKISNQQIFIPRTFKKKIGLLTIIPILNDNKEVEELVGSIEDITDTYEEEKRRKDLESITSKINHATWIGETVNGNKDSFKYTFMSDNMFDIHGIEKQEALKGIKLWLNVVHEDDMSLLKEWLEIEDYPKKIHYKINTPKKGIRWISNETFKEGRDKFFGIITDITEEKEREQEKEAILQTLNAATDAIKIAKIKGEKKEYIYVNNANKSLYELPLSKIKNNPELWKEYLHPDDKEKLTLIDKEKQKGHLHLNYRLLLPDGRIKYIEENIFREIFDGVLYSGTIKRDATDIHKENLTMQAILKALDVSKDAIWVTTSGLNVYMNPARADLYEKSLKEIMKDPDFWKPYLHPDDCDRILKEANSTNFNGKIISQKFRLVMPDGRIKYIIESKFARVVDGIKYAGGIQAEVEKKVYSHYK